MTVVQDEMDKHGCRQRWMKGQKDAGMEEVDEERAVTETVLMMYRWPVSNPSPHQ